MTRRRPRTSPPSRLQPATAQQRRTGFGLASRFSAAHELEWDEERPRTLAWAQQVASRLAQVAVDVDVTVSVVAGRTGTAELVTFSPVGEEAAGVRLSLTVDRVKVEAGLEIDARGLATVRTPGPGFARALAAALHALPEQFTVSLGDEAERVLVHEARPARMREMASGERGAWVGWSVPRDVVVAHTDTLDEQLADAVVALGPLLKLLVDERSDRASAGPPLPAVGGRFHGARRPPLRRPALVTEVDPRQPVERGTRVRVLSGPFVGKTGVVQELDGKGSARVMLGLLATQVPVKDLIAAAEGAARPALSSSHRKPLPSR